MRDISIPDLRDPQRNEADQAIYDLGLSMQVDLSPAALIDRAMAVTGCRDFGQTGVLDRCEVLVEAVNADSGLSGIGRYLVRKRLLELLTARLRFEEFTKRNPESCEVELEPPVIVVGLPRSGTTHLVNLLAVDSRFRSMPWWEVKEPIPITGEGPGRDGVDPRFRRCEREHAAELQAAPLAALMHDRPPTSIEEECELMDLDICSYSAEWLARIPQWRDAYYQFNYDEHFAFLKRELSVLSWLRGPRRWVLKCPQHLEQIGPLMRAFPDATIAFTLRDPVAVLQSAVTMLAYADRNRRVTVDADALIEYWIDRIEHLLRAAVRDAALIPSPQRIDVEFRAFMADDLGAAIRIIELAGMDVDETQRAALGAYVASNPRGKDGRIVYDLRRDFHCDPEDLYERFAFYFEAFPQINREVY